tara:strand:- start:12 stop:227 length:216 start_codon:yes stop_codon:yes gene_type:complete
MLSQLLLPIEFDEDVAGVLECCRIRDLAMAKKLALETICRFDLWEMAMAMGRLLSILTTDLLPGTTQRLDR